MRWPLLMAEGEGAGTGSLGAGGGGSPAPGDGGAGTSTAPAPSGDWRSLLPEDVRADRGLDRFKDVGALYTSYRELEKKIGERAAPKPPGADATPEERAAWRQALGVPDHPAQYQYTPPQLPEGQQFDPGLTQGFLTVAHELNLTPAQVQGLIDWQAQTTTQAWDKGEEARLASVQAGEQAGRQRFGAAWPVKLALAKEVLRREGTSELAQTLDEIVVKGADGQLTALGNHVEFVNFLARAAEALGHSPYVIGEGGGVLSKASAQERLNAAYADNRAGKLDQAGLQAAIERYGPVVWGTGNGAGVSSGERR